MSILNYLIGETKFAVVTRSDDGTDEIVAADTKLAVKFIIVSHIDREA